MGAGIGRQFAQAVRDRAGHLHGAVPIPCELVSSGSGAVAHHCPERRSLRVPADECLGKHHEIQVLLDSLGQPPFHNTHRGHRIEGNRGGLHYARPNDSRLAGTCVRAVVSAVVTGHACTLHCFQP
ncbi:hypothetical protein GCM10014715_87850 [Streptomyces spiralis]|uniref:Uncharacterized protein n=1 Tax=Streptomyces spiralis TaxID=66376 RepID=A0A919E4U5_9ACTN|nr:hypothetical protein GCM10014715_87850 [Streptomyces spiralis]